MIGGGVMGAGVWGGGVLAGANLELITPDSLKILTAREVSRRGCDATPGVCSGSQNDRSRVGAADCLVSALVRVHVPIL